MRAIIPLAAALVLAAPPLDAQAHEGHDGHAAAGAAPPAGATAAPRQPGQAAYGAIAEVVRIHDADPATDWGRVDLERLRRHLIDMDEVTLRAAVAQAPVPGGARFVVTGEGRTRDAIARMVRAHAGQLAATPGLRAGSVERPDGAVMTVTAADPSDARAVARIRGLGFAGLLATGDHHGPHHLAIARGTTGAHPGH